MTSQIQDTIETYDVIAPQYLAQWRDRGVMRPQLERFAAHLPSGSRVLDIGCGPGFDAAILRQYGFQVFSFDLSWGMMQAGRAEFPGDFVQADMRFLPLAPCADSVWMNASLLHLPRPDVLPTLQGVTRVLRPRGIFFLTVKGGTGEQWTAYPAETSLTRFFTYWSADELDSTLAEAGFTLLEQWQSEAEGQSWLGRIAQRA